MNFNGSLRLSNSDFYITSFSRISSWQTKMQCWAPWRKGKGTAGITRVTQIQANNSGRFCNSLNNKIYLEWSSSISLAYIPNRNHFSPKVQVIFIEYVMEYYVHTTIFFLSMELALTCTPLVPLWHSGTDLTEGLQTDSLHILLPLLPHHFPSLLIPFVKTWVEYSLECTCVSYDLCKVVTAHRWCYTNI